MTFKEIVGEVVSIINYLVPAVFALTVLFFLWGIFRYVFAGDSEDDLRKARQIMVWGIVILAIMLSTWGILQILQNTILEGIDSGGTGGTISI